MNDNKQYAFWSLNILKSTLSNDGSGFVHNCSSCGLEVVGIDGVVDTCPECGAVMVEPLGRKDINGHDICAGDEIECNIARYKGKVQGKIVYDGMWYLDNPVSFRFMYDCSNIRVTKGVIPEGKYLINNLPSYDLEAEQEDSAPGL